MQRSLITRVATASAYRSVYRQAPVMRRFYSEGDKVEGEQNGNKKEEKKAEEPEQQQGEEKQPEKTEESVLAEKDKQISEFKDAYVRCLADQENLRNRTRKEIETTKEYAIQKFATELLDTADILGMALTAVPEAYRGEAKTDDASNETHATLTNLYTGVRMTETELLKTLSRHGVERYWPEGEVFDPNLHQAVFQAPIADKTPGTIFAVQKAGFKMKSRVLRPAQMLTIACFCCKSPNMDIYPANFPRCLAALSLLNTMPTLENTRSSDLIPPHIKPILRQDYAQIDPQLPELLQTLRDVGTPECWHKHSSFYDHLLDVYLTCKIWKLPDAVARCGLLHSAYSNSYVNLAVFRAKEERGRVRALLGEEAEALVYLFCIIDRHELINERLLKQLDATCSNVDKVVPRDGLTMKHIKTGEPIHLTLRQICIFLVLTIADFTDQTYGWQDALWNRTDGSFSWAPVPPNQFSFSLWPGDGKPGLWHGNIACMAYLCRACCEGGNEDLIPPVFHGGRDLVPAEDVVLARDLYWEIIQHRQNLASTEEAEKTVRLLDNVVSRNPHVGEPHLLAAQIHLRLKQWSQAEAEAKKALELFLEWGTVWDKRMMWNAWVAFSRVCYESARQQQWAHERGPIAATPRETATMPAIVNEDSEEDETEEADEGRVDVGEEVTAVGGLEVENNVRVLVDWTGVGEAGGLDFTFMPPKARVPLLTPPEQYGIVEAGVFRSDMLQSAHLPFIRQLKLKTILVLSPELPGRAVLNYLEEAGVNLVHLGLTTWKPANTPLSWRPVSEELIKEGLEMVLDVDRHPMLLMCTSGMHDTGTLVGCLRKLQHWNFSAICNEYRNFAGTKARYINEQFIELFDLDLITLPPNLPTWYIQQAQLWEQEQEQGYASTDNSIMDGT
ncbi:hypothetical protein BZG36_05187 [Bifiguratus adelaidae]|uniref:GrpE protein homolog, mitochondrial n=1 Tax=Bifiguratus adelaidae TaxID=1938954 RepID=A0A261XTR4_9FUNG|nr:hypothetical protein BZG36_05187 [Bifiguratus adelaidae]